MSPLLALTSQTPDTAGVPRDTTASGEGKGADASRGRLAAVSALLVGAYLSREGAADAFRRQFKKDALGHRIHTALAVLTLAGICCKIGVVEFAIIPLAAFSAIRVLNVWRCWVYAALSPVGAMMIGLSVWAWASLLWTGDVAQGLDEVYNTRWVFLPGLTDAGRRRWGCS